MLSNALTLVFSSVHGKHSARGASSQQQQMQTTPEKSALLDAHTAGAVQKD